MSLHLSPAIEERLLATAQAEGVPVERLLEQWIEERDEMAAIVSLADAQMPAMSLDQARDRVEQGYLQSERGEVVDGETFMRRLIDGMDEPK